MYFKYCTECSLYNKANSNCKIENDINKVMVNGDGECELFVYKNNYETINEDEIICPYCGYRDHNSWDYDEGEYDIQCVNCEREFYVNAELEIRFSTSPTIKNIIDIINKDKETERKNELSLTDKEKELILSIKLVDNYGYISVMPFSEEDNIFKEITSKGFVDYINDLDYRRGENIYALSEKGMRLVERLMDEKDEK